MEKLLNKYINFVNGFSFFSLFFLIKSFTHFFDVDHKIEKTYIDLGIFVILLVSVCIYRVKTDFKKIYQKD